MSPNQSSEIEMLDVVDDADQVIGTISFDDYYARTDKPGNIRSVELFIVNSQGELWIPRRTAAKKIAPNGLDYSMGGHVSAGETYMEACRREAREELNLDLPASQLQFIAHFGPDEGLSYFRELYVVHRDETPVYNRDDFVSAEWLPPEVLLERLQSGEAAKLSLLPTLEKYLEVVTST